MRDPARIDKIITALCDYWRSNPDLRLCQIIGNFTNQTTGQTSSSYYIEDDLILSYLNEHLHRTRT